MTENLQIGITRSRLVLCSVRVEHRYRPEPSTPHVDVMMILYNYCGDCCLNFYIYIILNYTTSIFIRNGHRDKKYRSLSSVQLLEQHLKERIYIGERNMAEFTAEQLSGLAGEIRSSLTSDQYDLGGYTEQRAKDLIHSAFRYIKISKHEIHGTRFERCFPSFF